MNQDQEKMLREMTENEKETLLRNPDEDTRKRLLQRRFVFSQPWRYILRRYLYILWNPISRFLYFAWPVALVLCLLVCPNDPAGRIFITSLIFPFIGLWIGTFAFLYNAGAIPSLNEPSALFVNYNGKGYPRIGYVW